MPDDDEILSAYERELGEEPAPRPRSNRGFWMVVGTIGLACVVLVVEILVNRPLGNDIGHAEYSLRQAEAGANRLLQETGTLERADAQGLAAVAPQVRYVGPDTASSDPGEASVVASPGLWAAAVQARPGACFYIRLTDAGDVTYGVGTGCTGRDALGASDTQW
ncbi:MAG: hypothetical protein ACM3OO_08660 [Planctomycetaceae bacterium]